MPDHTRNVDHAARLLALMEADDLSYLKHHTCQEIADQFGINKSSISRDLKQIRELRRLLGVYRVKLKNLS